MASSENSLPPNSHLKKTRPRCPFYGLVALFSPKSNTRIFIKSEIDHCPLIRTNPDYCKMGVPNWDECPLNNADNSADIKKIKNDLRVWSEEHKPANCCFWPGITFLEWEKEVMGQPANGS